MGEGQANKTHCQNTWTLFSEALIARGHLSHMKINFAKSKAENTDRKQ